MNKNIINTKNAPAAVGPYSQAVKSGNLLFVSGQIPLAPAGGNIVGDNVQIQTRQVLENLKAVIEAANLNLNNVIKCTCFLQDMNDFATFNNAYAEYFGDAPPARECVEVARLPRDVKVEISAICETTEKTT